MQRGLGLSLGYPRQAQVAGKIWGISLKIPWIYGPKAEHLLINSVCFQNHRTKTSFKRTTRARIFPHTGCSFEVVLLAVSSSGMGLCLEPASGNHGHGLIQGISLTDLADLAVLGRIGLPAIRTDNNPSFAALSKMFLPDHNRT